VKPIAEEPYFGRKKGDQRAKYMGTKRQTGACAGGYKNKGAISRTTTFTSGHRKSPRFTIVSDPFNRQEPARRRAAEGSPVKKKKAGRRKERERERGGSAVRRLNGSAKLTMIYGVGVPHTPFY